MRILHLSANVEESRDAFRRFADSLKNGVVRMSGRTVTYGDMEFFFRTTDDDLRGMEFSYVLDQDHVRCRPPR